MATRIYLPSSGAAPVTPSTWNFANQVTPLTFAGVLARLNSTMTTSLKATGTTSPTLRAMFRWVIGPLSAQTIAGTINLVMQCFESATGANATLAVAVKIIQPGGADRAVLLAAVGSDSAASPQEMGVSPLANKRAWSLTEERPIPLTSQNATAGDYLVIEVGFRSATTTTRNISIRYGDTTAGELADADSGANDYAPWIDFSQTLLFPEQHSGAALISGNGSQVGSVLKGGIGSALVSAAGALLAIGVAGMLAVASISGGGSQFAVGKKDIPSSISISGNGSLVATGEKGVEQHSGVASISGSGAILSEGKKNAQISVSISANGPVISEGKKSGSSLISISANGSLSSGGTKQVVSSLSITGNGLFIANGLKAGRGTASISGDGITQGIGIKQAVGDLTITGNGSLVASGTPGGKEEYSGSGVISGNGALSSLGGKGASSSVAITGNGFLVAVGEKTVVQRKLKLASNTFQSTNPGPHEYRIFRHGSNYSDVPGEEEDKFEES